MTISLQKIIYLAGPMTGIDRFNFPAFDDAARRLRRDGYAVISPAEMDREDGFDESGLTGHETLSVAEYQRFARNDLGALLQVDMVVLLPGWRQSTGATNESNIAAWLGLPCYEYQTIRVDDYVLFPIELTARWSGDKQNATRNARAEILFGAEELVNGDRNVQYGDPKADFRRTAAMWAAYLGVEIAPHDVAALMALLKVSRIRWSPSKQDSWTDLAGYAACGWDCASELVTPHTVATEDDELDELGHLSFVDHVAALPDEDDEPEPEPPTPAPTLRSVPARKAPAKVNEDNPAKKDGKWDWVVVGKIATDAQDAGVSIAKALQATLDVSQATAQWMVKRCRELGHLASSRESWTSEPIARQPFDPDKARAAAVGGL